jgi:hypothetical protein
MDLPLELRASPKLASGRYDRRPSTVLWFGSILKGPHLDPSYSGPPTTTRRSSSARITTVTSPSNTNQHSRSRESASTFFDIAVRPTPSFCQLTGTFLVQTPLGIFARLTRTTPLAIKKKFVAYSLGNSSQRMRVVQIIDEAEKAAKSKPRCSVT